MNRRRHINLRKPENLPNEEDVIVVRDYVISKMKSLTEDPFHIWDGSSFTKLRDSACTRLTLLNARRGGEPARLTIQQWIDGVNDKWIDKQRLNNLDNLDKLLVKSLKVVYLTGKGNNHLVPMLIPEDTVKALEYLSDTKIRSEAGVNIENDYLFPSTRNSIDHVSGWHSFHYICNDLVLVDPQNMKATSNRHRVSTIYAALDVPPAERQYFYKHMGHSEQINMDIYQAPLAVMEVTKIGKALLNIDGG